jgi:hypothetical protein
MKLGDVVAVLVKLGAAVWVLVGVVLALIGRGQ